MRVLVRLFIFFVCLLCLGNGAPARASFQTSDAGLPAFDNQNGAKIIYGNPPDSSVHYDCIAVSAAGEKNRRSSGNGFISEEFGTSVAAESGESIVWPANRGFLKPADSAVLQPGSIVDRLGGNTGTFVAPQGTAFGARSLPASFASKPLNAFEVVKPINVDAGVSAPWFGQAGGGVQFELPQTVQELIESGHLRPVGN